MSRDNKPANRKSPSVCNRKLNHLEIHCAIFSERINSSFSRPLKVDGIEAK